MQFQNMNTLNWSRTFSPLLHTLHIAPRRHVRYQTTSTVR